MRQQKEKDELDARALHMRIEKAIRLKRSLEVKARKSKAQQSTHRRLPCIHGVA